MINSADLMGMVLQITSKLSVVQAVSVFNLTFLGRISGDRVETLCRCS